jgi:NACalpha-BTF3-like transcription factor
MSEITLEKIDIIRERSGVTYAEAKEALEKTDGNVVDALIYIENNKKSSMDGIYTSKDEFIEWLKDIIKKGNVNRIKIKKDEKVLVDIPVNAGIAATLTALVWPPLLAIGLLTAVFTKITVEIVRDDGSVEIVNKIIKSTVKDMKGKAQDAFSSIKDKFSSKSDAKDEDNNSYSYTVKFDDADNTGTTDATDDTDDTCNTDNMDNTDEDTEKK